MLLQLFMILLILQTLSGITSFSTETFILPTCNTCNSGIVSPMKPLLIYNERNYSVFSSSIIFYTGFCKLTPSESKASKHFVYHCRQLVKNYQESSENVYEINIPKLFIRGTKEGNIYSCICPPLFMSSQVGINSATFYVANM